MNNIGDDVCGAYYDGLRDGAPKWIKTADRLPEDGERVLVTECGRVFVDPCANCSNRDCANSLLARWWDLCVESKFTLFKQIAPPLPGAIEPEAGEKSEV